VKRVLVISPHFPPDTGAASHRMRLLAPRLPEHGWEPTIIAIDPRDLGPRSEPELVGFVHGTVRIERVRAFGGPRRRFLGVGDLGLRSLSRMERRAKELLAGERYDIVLITLPPHYTAILGPRLYSASSTPYVLDYQDPWVSAWGLTVGGGPHATVDWKSRLSRWLALALEPRTLRSAAGLTAVSEGTLQGIFERHPALRSLPSAEIPLGGEPRDFLRLSESPRSNHFFDAADGLTHVAYVGTLPPSGGSEVLGAFLAGAALLFQEARELRSKVRFHFIGMSMQSAGTAPGVVRILARSAGVDDVVDEHPLRIDYLDALTVLSQAGAVLLLGGTERHYTASRVYPALLTGKPLVAVYHEASTVCDVIRRHGPAAATHLVTFGDTDGPTATRAAVARALASVLGGAPNWLDGSSLPDLGPWSASALAGRMATFLSVATNRWRDGASRRG
jgi:hypothetical protein